nr:pentatricopeptide repeat-containing protein At3g53700, chloroplastic [Ipomoea batatas]
MGVSSCLANVPPFTISLNSPKLFSSTFSQRREPLVSISATSSPSAASVSLLKSKHLPPDFTQKQLQHSLRQGKDETSAFNLFTWALAHPESEPSRQICEEILRKLGKAGSFDAMRRVLDGMKESKVEIGEGTFIILIESYAKFDLYDEAIGVLDVMEQEFDVKPGIFSYNNLLNVLVDGRKFNKLEVVEDVLSRMLSEGLKPDVPTFNILIKALCKAHQIRAAILMMEDMPQHGLSPNEKTFTTGFCNSGKVEVATRLLRSIEMKGMVQTPQSYTPIIQALFRQKRTKEAMRLFREMEAKAGPPDYISYKIVFRGLCFGGGPIDEAVNFAVEMMKKGHVPEFSSFSILAERLFTLARKEALVKFIDMIMKKAEFSDDEEGRIKGLLKIHKFTDALATLGRVLNRRHYC